MATNQPTGAETMDAAAKEIFDNGYDGEISDEARRQIAYSADRCYGAGRSLADCLRVVIASWGWNRAAMTVAANTYSRSA